MSDNQDRYFVDDRCGCVAIRDRSRTDPEYQGLHECTDGVVEFKMKSRINEVCAACGHVREVYDGSGGLVAEMQFRCDNLNHEWLTKCEVALLVKAISDAELENFNEG